MATSRASSVSVKEERSDRVTDLKTELPGPTAPLSSSDEDFYSENADSKTSPAW